MTEMKLGTAWLSNPRSIVPVTQNRPAGGCACGKSTARQSGMKVVYVAGPFRGKDSWEIEQNIRRAEALALEVWRMGAACICPHSNTRFFQGAAPDHVWLDGDIEILNRCDAVLMTPVWHRSIGATAERDHALARGIPVFYDLDALHDWLND